MGISWGMPVLVMLGCAFAQAKSGLLLNYEFNSLSQDLCSFNIVNSKSKVVSNLKLSQGNHLIFIPFSVGGQYQLNLLCEKSAYRVGGEKQIFMTVVSGKVSLTPKFKINYTKGSLPKISIFGNLESLPKLKNNKSIYNKNLISAFTQKPITPELLNSTPAKGGIQFGSSEPSNGTSEIIEKIMICKKQESATKPLFLGRVTANIARKKSGKITAEIIDQSANSKDYIQCLQSGFAKLNHLSSANGTVSVSF